MKDSEAFLNFLSKNIFLKKTSSRFWIILKKYSKQLIALLINDKDIKHQNNSIKYAVLQNNAIKYAVLLLLKELNAMTGIKRWITLHMIRYIKAKETIQKQKDKFHIKKKKNS